MGNVNGVGNSPSTTTPPPVAQTNNNPPAVSDPHKTAEPKDQTPVKADAQTASEMKAEKGLEGTARQAQLQKEVTPNLPDTLDAAKKAGLKKEEAGELENRLNKMTPKEREQELRFLNGNVLGSPNADRGLRTYMELQKLRDVNPSRVNGETVRTLTRGVVERRTNDPNGREGVMGQKQAVDAAKTMMAMPQSDFDHLQKTLAKAGEKDGKPIPGSNPYTERAMILKSVAARDQELSSPGTHDRYLQSVNKPSKSMQEIQTYADEIRGTPREKLIQQSTVLDVDGKNPNAVMQRYHDSCGPTVSQMARAEGDPIYAKKLHESGVWSGESQSDLANEQKKLLEQHGGKAVPVTDPSKGSVGLDTKPLETLLNEHASPSTNKKYKATEVDTGLGTPEQKRKIALNKIEERLKGGEDVPIGVKWNEKSGHILMMSDVRGRGMNQEFLVTDPQTGESSWVRRNDIENGKTKFSPSSNSQGDLSMYMQ
jgi:hypothetical protein